jgi:hypothetical protein
MPLRPSVYVSSRHAPINLDHKERIPVIIGDHTSI